MGLWGDVEDKLAVGEAPLAKRGASKWPLTARGKKACLGARPAVKRRQTGDRPNRHEAVAKKTSGLEPPGQQARRGAMLNGRGARRGKERSAAFESSTDVLRAPRASRFAPRPRLLAPGQSWKTKMQRSRSVGRTLKKFRAQSQYRAGRRTPFAGSRRSGARERAGGAGA